MSSSSSSSVYVLVPRPFRKDAFGMYLLRNGRPPYESVRVTGPAHRFDIMPVSREAIQVDVPGPNLQNYEGIYEGHLARLSSRSAVPVRIQAAPAAAATYGATEPLDPWHAYTIAFMHYMRLDSDKHVPAFDARYRQPLLARMKADADLIPDNLAPNNNPLKDIPLERLALAGISTTWVEKGMKKLFLQLLKDIEQNHIDVERLYVKGSLELDAMTLFWRGRAIWSMLNDPTNNVLSVANRAKMMSYLLDTDKSSADERSFAANIKHLLRLGDAHGIPSYPIFEEGEEVPPKDANKFASVDFNVGQVTLKN